MAEADRLNRPVERSGRAAAVARESESSLRLLAAIVESSEDAIIAMDLQGRIVEWNRSAERLFGYPARRSSGAPSRC